MFLMIVNLLFLKHDFLITYPQYDDHDYPQYVEVLLEIVLSFGLVSEHSIEREIIENTISFQTHNAVIAIMKRKTHLQVKFCQFCRITCGGDQAIVAFCRLSLFT